MPLLRPMNTILRESGLIPKEEQEINADEVSSSDISEILNAKGITISKALNNVRDLMNSDKDEIKKAATELALKLHKVMVNDKPEAEKIVFNISTVIEGKVCQVDLAGIFLPNR